MVVVIECNIIKKGEREGKKKKKKKTLYIQLLPVNFLYHAIASRVPLSFNRPISRYVGNLAFSQNSGTTVARIRAIRIVFIGLYSYNDNNNDYIRFIPRHFQAHLPRMMGDTYSY